MINNTLNNQKDNSLVSNAFDFMRFPLHFSAYDSDAQ
ncbi:Agmatinase [Arsenophonus endosymbiont of Bemisia tabaci Q2]|nr:Agmatinase [Arsenophonus endosymbiont of Bemisia tabaci Q2]